VLSRFDASTPEKWEDADSDNDDEVEICTLESS
jgi:hypothetical protein